MKKKIVLKSMIAASFLSLMSFAIRQVIQKGGPFTIHPGLIDY
jgi:hypothetical protein